MTALTAREAYERYLRGEWSWTRLVAFIDRRIEQRKR